MTKKDLMLQVAKLESINDQLVTEISYVDDLMRMIGFANGLKTVKETAQEMLIHPESEEEQDEASES